ncbi:MAG: nuclear transport factor 2 family protein [Actinomycetia bacterium]|nr:nuclear transport factor 2 family protein [Actinomycetes bacterium]
MAYSLEQLSDRQDIIDVLFAYCRAIDDNRPDDVITMFTDDCEYDYGGDHGLFSTKDHAYMFFRAGTDKIYKRSAHYVSNIEVSFSGPDRADSIAYVNAWHEFNDDISNAWFFGRYVDHFVRTGDGWRIAGRRVDTMGHEAWPREVTHMERNVLPPRNPAGSGPGAP